MDALQVAYSGFFSFTHFLLSRHREEHNCIVTIFIGSKHHKRTVPWVNRYKARWFSFMALTKRSQRQEEVVLTVTQD